MSHDRGCWKCFEDRDHYEYCKDPKCPKKSVVEMWKKGRGLK